MATYFPHSINSNIIIRNPLWIIDFYSFLYAANKFRKINPFGYNIQRTANKSYTEIFISMHFDLKFRIGSTIYYAERSIINQEKEIAFLAISTIIAVTRGALTANS